MARTSVKCIPATGQRGNSFVGLKVKGNDVFIHYPEAYTSDPESLKCDNYADVLELLKSISLAKTQIEGGEERIYDTHTAGGDFAILSYIRLIEDYMQNGIYFDTEKTYRSNINGKISWKRTLDGQPLISKGNVVYKDLIVEVKSPVESILVECYKYCLRKSLNLMGWRYGLSADMLSLPIYPEEREPMYLHAVMTELDRTFDDRRYTRLMHMKNILTGLNEVRTDEGFIYGVDAYDYVFERMVDSVLGTVSAREISDYYPSVEWHLRSGKSSYSHLRPDTIMRSGDAIYVIDSKYYRYGSLDLAKTDGLPDVSSIQKQVAYGSYIYQKQIHENDDCTIYNVFMLPYDSKRINAGNTEGANLFYAGYAQTDWDKGETYSHIHTFLIDLSYLIHHWYRRRDEVLEENLTEAVALSEKEIESYSE